MIVGVRRLRPSVPAAWWLFALGVAGNAGVATWDGTETSDELTARADAALYAAKNAGRNRVASAGQDVPAGSGHA